MRMMERFKVGTATMTGLWERVRTYGPLVAAEEQFKAAVAAGAIAVNAERSTTMPDPEHERRIAVAKDGVQRAKRAGAESVREDWTALRAKNANDFAHVFRACVEAADRLREVEDGGRRIGMPLPVTLAMSELPDAVMLAGWLDRAKRAGVVVD